MSILRNKFKDRFVQVPNVLVTDTRISIPARLVYVYLRSKPDGWIVRNCDVMKSLGIKDNGAMAKYWHELETSGWIVRHKTATGTFDYELNEADPIGEKPNEGISAIREKPNKGKTPAIYNTDSLSNTDLLNSNNPPYIPPEEKNPETPPKADNSKEIISELKRRVNALFNRRDTTTWTDKETAKLRQVAKRNGVLEECAEIERLYNSGYEYRRRDIITFLNNWTTELDRARNYKPKQSKYDRTTREVNYDPGF